LPSPFFAKSFFAKFFLPSPDFALRSAVRGNLRDVRFRRFAMIARARPSPKAGAGMAAWAPPI
jgi:hypothetical protein